MPTKDKKKILLVGYGGMGKKYYELLRNKFDVHVLEKKKIEKKNFYQKITGLKLEKYKFGIISSPANTHYYYCKKFINNNLSFIVEKPLFVNSQNWIRLINKLKKTKVVAEVAYPRRYAKSYNYIQKLIKQNLIGKIRIIRFNFSQNFKKYRKDYKKTYFSKLKTGGGITRDALVHHINLASFFLGTPSNIDIYEKRISFKDINVPDLASLRLNFKKNYYCEIFGNQFQKPNVDEIEVIGDKGNLKFNRLDKKLYFMNEISKKVIKKFDETYNDIFRSQVFNFIKALKSRKKLKTSIIEEYNNLKKLEQN